MHKVSAVFLALPGLHYFTRLDAMRSFAWKGKVKAFMVLTFNTKAMQEFTVLCQSWELTEDLTHRLEEVNCSLYSPKTTIRNVNELRYDLFCVTNGEIESHQSCHLVKIAFVSMY